MKVRNNEKNARSLKYIRKDLRSNGTPAEAKLWSLIKNRQVENLKFRRQFSIGNYILDFYCPELKLCIELDGDYHYNSQKHEMDKNRDSRLYEELSIKTLRFENHIVVDNPNIIIYNIIRVKNEEQCSISF